MTRNRIWEENIGREFGLRSRGEVSGGAMDVKMVDEDKTRQETGGGLAEPIHVMKISASDCIGEKKKDINGGNI